MAVSSFAVAAVAQSTDASRHQNSSKQKSSDNHAVQEYHAAPIQPYQAQPIQPYHAQPVQPNKPATARKENDGSAAPARAASGPQFFFRTFGLAIPGVAYTVDNYATNTRTLTTSAGALTSSAVRIHPDHTYEWNSQWDGKLIHGRWVEKDGGILLLHGQEGKDWLLRAKERPSGAAVVTLWDQNSIWYDGTPLR